MTTKTTKTVLFASLIAAMILPFGMVNSASAETISDTIVESRSFSQDNHKVFKSYVSLERDDNDWNKAMIKENIKNYNIETKIGHNVDGYELVALYAQEQILKNQFVPSTVEERLFSWASSKYDLPNDEQAVKDRIIETVGKNHVGHAKQLADSLLRLAELGVVSPEIHKSDTSFWNAVVYESYCGMTDECEVENQLQYVAYIGAPITRVAYVHHIATVSVTYENCETAGETCTEFKTHVGSGQKTTNFNPPNDEHIGDSQIYTSLTSWSDDGDNVFASAQVTWPVAGTMLVASDNDGYASKSGNISHPNYYAWSIPNIQFKSHATN